MAIDIRYPLSHQDGVIAMDITPTKPSSAD